MEVSQWKQAASTAPRSQLNDEEWLVAVPDSLTVMSLLELMLSSMQQI